MQERCRTSFRVPLGERPEWRRCFSSPESAEARARIGIADVLFEDGLPPGSDLAYQLWLNRQEAPNETELATAERHVAALEQTQRATPIGLLLAVPPVRPDLLRETVASLARQLWTRFELLLICPPGLPHAARAAAKAVCGGMPQARLVEAPARVTRPVLPQPGSRRRRPGTSASSTRVTACPIWRWRCWPSPRGMPGGGARLCRRGSERRCRPPPSPV